MSGHAATGGTDPKRTALLALGALGVVYGDIGTSPLYAMRESFTGHAHQLTVDETNVLGILSLIFWSLIIIITIKYLAFVMKADNEGEGGILALTAIINPRGSNPSSRRWVLVLIGLFGTALLYGDGMITPAISVLSAVEGLTVVNPDIERLVIPIAVGILIAIFAVQRRGTGSIGRVFGPIMVVWFVTMAVLGAIHLADHPGVFVALNPTYAVGFFTTNTFTGFLALGSVFLVVTGGEALYADMGHFGKRPIKLGWFSLVLPALLLNYFGQGAMLINEPTEIESPFFNMAPDWFQLPLVALATAATVIASQALISGAFSLTMQAVQLGYSPRVRIRHTSAAEMGQIYISAINWALMAACVTLVITFRSSTNLAAAYGVAVTMTMVITTLLFYVVARERLGWSKGRAMAACTGFLAIDLGFFGANIFKIHEGGWFPIVVGAVVFTVLTTWFRGRQIVADRIMRGRVPITTFVKSIHEHPVERVDGTAVYMFSATDLTPPSLMANLKHNNSLHEKIVLLSIRSETVPRLLPVQRLTSTEIGDGFWQVILHYGFMEDPDIPAALAASQQRAPHIDPEQVSYFLGRENLIVTNKPGMAKWREHLFAFLSRNATPASNYFRLPANQTVEIGIAVEL